jgi:hypothetical protein
MDKRKVTSGSAARRMSHGAFAGMLESQNSGKLAARI